MGFRGFGRGLVLAATVSLAVVGSVAEAQGPRFPAVPPQAYVGQYICGGQPTAVTVDVGADGSGTFAFSTGAASGSYRVRLEPLADGRVLIRPLQWISRPAGFVAVPVLVRQIDDRLEGQVQGMGCGAFRARASTGSVAGRPAVGPSIGGDAPIAGRPGRPPIGRPPGGFDTGPANAPAARGQVDGPTLVTRARQAVAQQPDAARCIADRAAFLKRAQIPRGLDEAEFIVARPQLYQAVAEGMMCIERMAKEHRARIAEAIDRDPSALDLKSLGARVQAAGDAVNQNGDNIANLGAHFRNVWYAERTIGPAAAAMKGAVDAALTRRIDTSDGVMSYVVFDSTRAPERDFYGNLVARVDAARSVAEVNAMAVDLVPVFNAVLFPFAVPRGSDVSGWNGAGRQDVAAGRNPVEKARSDPNPKTLFWMVAALGDPVQRAALSAKARPVAPGAPTASGLASMFAQSFLKAEVARADTISKTWFSSGTFGPYGAMVEWGMPNRIVTRTGASLPLYSEEYRFMVNDLAGPECTLVKGQTFRCKFQYALEVRYEGLPDELARGLGALLGVGESAEQRQRAFSDRIAKRNFDWQRGELVVTKLAAGWEAAEVDAQMSSVAAKVDQVRQARIRAFQAGADGVAAARQSHGACDAFAAGAMAVGRMSEYLYYKYAC